MLINTPLRQGDTVTIKFNSGEEVVARLEADTTADKIQISKPVSLVQSGQGVGFAPWLFTAEVDQGTLTINLATVAVVTRTAEAAASAYIKQTTGIETSI